MLLSVFLGDWNFSGGRYGGVEGAEEGEELRFTRRRIWEGMNEEQKDGGSECLVMFEVLGWVWLETLDLATGPERDWLCKAGQNWVEGKVGLWEWVVWILVVQLDGLEESGLDQARTVKQKHKGSPIVASPIVRLLW